MDFDPFYIRILWGHNLVWTYRLRAFLTKESVPPTALPIGPPAGPPTAPPTTPPSVLEFGLILRHKSVPVQLLS